MKIVIEKESIVNVFAVSLYAITGGDYKYIKETVIELVEKMEYTPIPEGHGRLIDADDVKENHRRWIGYLDEDMIARLNIAIDRHVPTIIEADKGEQE